MQSKLSRKRKTRGLTIIETLVSATISILVLYSSVLLMFAGTTSWYKGEGKMLAETQSQRGVRIISQKLREAMAVTVDANGMGVNFRYPQKDGDGNYITPAVWDNVTRRLEYSDGRILLTEGGSSRVLCGNVILTDPKSTSGTAPYVPFAKGAGAITRQLTVMLATQTNTSRGAYTKSRSRETIYLRNIPELSRG